MQPCSVSSCEDSEAAKGLCRFHYQRKRNGQELDVPRKVVRKRSGKECSVDECGRPHSSKGLCGMHAKRLRRSGTTDDPKPKGQPIVNGYGYVMIWCPDHPDSYKPSNRIPEHRLVMEEMLGRRLLPGENVHHRNGVRYDNRPSNLELWIVHQPKGQRPEDLLEWAHEVIERYES